MNSSQPALLSAKQTAERLGVSDKMVYRLFHSGKLRGIRVEGAIRIYAASVTAYIASHTNAPEKEVVPPPAKKGRKRDDFTDYYLAVMERVARKQERSS